MKRRDFITTSALSGAAWAGGASSLSGQKPRTKRRYQNGKSPWPVCLDFATIRPAKGLREKVDIAIKAGYDAVEPWDRDLEEYEKSGGDLKEMGKYIKDNGLFVPSMIGLWGALPETKEAFQNSLSATRNRMRMASEIGCEHVQTIPNQVGENFDRRFVSDCYRQLIEIGINDYNVKPALVFVEMFPLKTMGQALGIAADADHPEARIIPDVFHMYISGGGFDGLKLLQGNAIAIFQFNDAPKDMAMEDMKDKDRVFPGDGILPLPKILKDLNATGFDGCVSLELYNPTYYKRDLLEVAKTGLSKTLEVIRKAEV
ncbi:sugar phosphate isomerase/epimerase [Membranicola marinus]|uniref:Sugar phosphate isomerase/epimerase n=1 Tax=Membranihabitans marinus TaxID=1227546 RepID=A0A953LCB2_9BACT|nr:sugar phosphate isomerase/epimerase family protein [Membranihabitans marinus]MBY5957569.1 sugar phosphate isomerase/epimerase [Membranihabitans marinus]